VNRTTTFLLLVLVTQCLIAAMVFWPRAPANDGGAGIALLPSFDSAAVDTVQLRDALGNKVVLQRSGDQWTIPGETPLPADVQLVDTLLTALSRHQRGWPVAHTEQAHRRFQVDTEYFQRRIDLAGDGQALARLYLGASPSFRRSHVRNATQQNVYSITLDTSSLPLTGGAWVDPRLLQVRVPLRIDADLYSVHYENDRWLAAGGLPANKNEAAALVNALKTLQVGAPATSATADSLALTEADLILSVQSLGGDSTLALYTEGGRHFIKSSEYPWFFVLRQGDYRRLTEVDIDLISGEPRTREQSDSLE